MAALAQQKVLRIGIIQDGKIVQERLIKAGESVTVGESAKNTFVLPKTHLPAGEFPLFQAKGSQYVLSFTERMKGKISSGGAVVALEKLREDSSVTRLGDLWTLPLTEQDRGKVTVDEVTVLFQFVPPPPVQAIKPMEAMDFRPRLLEDDDPVFLGFLAIFAALAAILMVWVWTAEQRSITSLEDIPDRFTKLVIEKKPDTPPEALVREDENARSTAPDRKEKRDEPKEAKATEAPRTKVEEAQARETQRQEVMQRSTLLRMIGTTGAHGSGTAENLWSDDDAGLGDIGKAFEGAGGIEIGTADRRGLKKGTGTGTEDVGIGDVASARAGSASVGSGPAVTMKGDLQLGAGDIPDEVGDASAVKKVVQAKAGQLKYCYENRLKENPTLAGRVEVEWNVSAGRVTNASIFANTTGDQALASCIIEKIQRWRFPDDVQGVISWPFVFKPSN